MNNFSLPADPLLFGRTVSSASPTQFDYPIMQKMMEQKYNDYRPYPIDYVDDLEKKMAELSDEELSMLNADIEYQNLSRNLSAFIQSEILALIRARINSNPDAVKNMERQGEIIGNVKASVKNAERENMREIKEYLQNYSSMSFDDYRSMKTTK